MPVPSELFGYRMVFKASEDLSHHDLNFNIRYSGVRRIVPLVPETLETGLGHDPVGVKRADGQRYSIAGTPTPSPVRVL